MMHGIIITNQEKKHSEYKINRFLEEAKSLDISLDVFVNDGNLYHFDRDGSASINLPPADFVIYLDKDYYLAKTLEVNGYRLFDQADFIRICDDKIITYIRCLNLGIKMPKTCIAPLFYGDELKDDNYKFLNTVGNDLHYPLIVKRVYSSLGEGVFKANNIDELINLYKRFAKEPLLFQEDVISSYGKSVRVLIIDGKVFGAYLRYSDTDFRSNHSSLVKGKSFDDPLFISFAQDIADKLDIEYAGIDLLFSSDNEPILCEINSNAFFEIFENTTGKNVAKAYLEMIIRKIKDE